MPSSGSSAKQNTYRAIESGLSSRPLSIAPDHELYTELDRSRSAKQQVKSSQSYFPGKDTCWLFICVHSTWFMGMIRHAIMEKLFYLGMLAAGAVQAWPASRFKATEEDDPNCCSPRQ